MLLVKLCVLILSPLLNLKAVGWTEIGKLKQRRVSRVNWFDAMSE